MWTIIPCAAIGLQPVETHDGLAVSKRATGRGIGGWRTRLRGSAGIGIALAVSWCLAALAGAADDLPAIHRVDAPEARWVFVNMNPEALGSLRAAYGQAKTGLEARLGWHVDILPTVMVVGDRERFKAISGRPGIAGFAVPDRMTMVLDYPGAVAAGTLVPLIRHELCHLLLHRHIPSGLLPRWLDEGVAQWASDGLSELVDGGDRRLLQRAVNAGRHFSLRELDEAFYGSPQTVALAYAQSAGLVRFLVDRFGDRALVRLLEDMGRGVDLDAGVRLAAGISVSEWEALWERSFKTVGARLAALAAHLYPTLFFLMALLTLVAFARYRRRRRAMAAEEEDTTEHRGPTSSGPPLH